MYVVLGASGNTGHVVAKNLLAHGQKVRVVGRNAAHLQPLAAEGAEIFLGDASDASVLTKAFHKADAAYVMVPPNSTSNDYRVFQDRSSDAIAAAVRNAGVKHIVSLSSFGADKPSGTGPVAGLHDLEQKLNQIDGANVLHLRAGYFMENTLPQVGAIRMIGSMIGPVTPDLKLPPDRHPRHRSSRGRRSLAAGVPGQAHAGTTRAARSRLQRSRQHCRERRQQARPTVHPGAQRSDSSRDGADGNLRQHGRLDPGDGRRPEHQAHAHTGTPFRRQHNADKVRNLCRRVLRPCLSTKSSSVTITRRRHKQKRPR